MRVPFAQLSSEAQDGVIDNFIEREGTDYGAVEVSPERKRAQVRAAIERDQVILVFDVETESITLLTEREYRLSSAGGESD